MEDNTDALKAELETIKAQLAEKEAALLAAQTESNEIKANLEVINTEFVALKKTIIGSGAKFETSEQTFVNSKKVEAEVKESIFDGVAARLKKK